MPSPDIPRPTPQEGELRQPRQGLKMAVRFTNLFGDHLTHQDVRSAAHFHLAQLEIQGIDGVPVAVHSKKYEDSPEHELTNSAMTIIQYLIRGDFSSAPEEYRGHLSTLAEDTVLGKPQEERAVQVVLVETPDEALYPRKFGGQHIYQFLLTKNDQADHS